MRHLGLKAQFTICGTPASPRPLAAGVTIKVASERAGHAGAAIALDVYAHAMPGMQEDAVNRIDAALRPHLKGKSVG